MKARKILITGMLPMSIFACVISCVVKAETYSQEYYTCSCECRTVTVYKLTSADYDQSTSAQNAAWAAFKAAYPGLVDSDRLGNRTYTYNCHAKVYGPSSRWLQGDQRYHYWGTTSGCWEIDGSGSIKSGYYHSCYVNNTGKCGAQFYCKNNQYVYGPQMPTVVYKKN